jgi:hypothetical protein
LLTLHLLEEVRQRLADGRGVSPSGVHGVEADVWVGLGPLLRHHDLLPLLEGRGEIS